MKDRFEGLVDHLLSGPIPMHDAIEILERGMIRGSLERSAGNQSAASKLLGIHRNTLQRKMIEYGLGNGRARPRRKPTTRQRRPQERNTGAA
jgi:DNA-binding NtrC family response regulator